MTIYVDRRYTGKHGIARYATEVLSRLDGRVETLPVVKSPTSPAAVLERGWRVPGRDDLIYSPGFGSGWTRARALLTVHDLIHIQGPSFGSRAIAHRIYYEQAVRPAIRRARAVFTVSETSASAIRDWLRDDTVEVVVTGNGCSDAFTTVGPSYQHPRPYLLYVGNAKPHKNPAAALGALRELPDFDIIVVSRDRAAFEQLAARADVTERMIVLCDVDDPKLASLYRGAQALIFPSKQEGFGLPVLESLSCGTPAVIARTCASAVEIAGEGPHVGDGSVADYVAAISAVAGAGAVLDRPSRYDWRNVAEVVFQNLSLET